jgi:hypothetical protein
MHNYSNHSNPSKVVVSMKREYKLPAAASGGGSSNCDQPASLSTVIIFVSHALIKPQSAIGTSI